MEGVAEQAEALGGYAYRYLYGDYYQVLSDTGVYAPYRARMVRRGDAVAMA